MQQLELDPIGVVEERRVVAGDVLRKLFRSALGLDVLGQNPLPALIDSVTRRRLEGEVMDTHGITIVGDRMRIRLFLAEAEPGVRGLQVPDRLATLALELEHAAPAETAKKRGVESLAPINIGDNEIQVVNPSRLHRSMLLGELNEDFVRRVLVVTRRWSGAGRHQPEP